MFGCDAAARSSTTSPCRVEVVVFRHRDRWVKVFVWFVVLMLVLTVIAAVFPAIS